MCHRPIHLVRAIGRHAQIEGAGAGLHLVLWLPQLGRARVDALIAACADRQVGVYSLAPHADPLPSRAGLLLGYGLVEPSSIEVGIKRVAEAYRELMRSASAAARPTRSTVDVSGR